MVHISQLAFFVELLESFANQVDVGPFPLIDLAPLSRCQASDLINDYGHRIVAIRRASAGDQLHMVGDNRSQPPLGIIDGASRYYYLLVELVHSVVHNAKQQVSLSRDVMVYSGLGNSDSFCDIVHRGRIIPFLADDLSSRAIDIRQTIRLCRGGHAERVFRRPHNTFDSYPIGVARRIKTVDFSEFRVSEVNSNPAPAPGK